MSEQTLIEPTVPPEVRFHIPSSHQTQKHKEEYKGFAYQVEPLHSAVPFLGALLRETTDWTLGVVSSSGKVTYSDQAKIHAALWETVPGEHNPLQGKGSRFQINPVSSDERLASVAGSKKQASETLDYLRRAGLDPQTRVIATVVHRLKRIRVHFGTLADINLDE